MSFVVSFYFLLLLFQLSRSKKQKTENEGAINTDEAIATDEPEDKSKTSDEKRSETKAPEKQVEKVLFTTGISQENKT